MLRRRARFKTLRHKTHKHTYCRLLTNRNSSLTSCTFAHSIYTNVKHVLK